MKLPPNLYSLNALRLCLFTSSARCALQPRTFFLGAKAYHTAVSQPKNLPPARDFSLFLASQARLWLLGALRILPEATFLGDGAGALDVKSDLVSYSRLAADAILHMDEDLTAACAADCSVRVPKRPRHSSR